MSKEIPLANGKGVVIVDDEDYEHLSQHKWRYTCGYATTDHYIGGKKNGFSRSTYKKTYMHRMIMNAPSNMSIDHINHNKLDNRRNNLRVVTQKQNVQHNRGNKNRTSIYKGVSWAKGKGKWKVQIAINGRATYQGLFEDEIMAAKHYDNLAKQQYGEFAYLNFPDDIHNTRAHFANESEA